MQIMIIQSWDFTLEDGTEAEIQLSLENNDHCTISLVHECITTELLAINCNPILLTILSIETILSAVFPDEIDFSNIADVQSIFHGLEGPNLNNFEEPVPIPITGENCANSTTKSFTS